MSTLFQTICQKCNHFGDTEIGHYYDDDDLFGFDHAFTPGETRTEDEWRMIRPVLFVTFPDGRIGPNSKFFPQKGKVCLTS